MHDTTPTVTEREAVLRERAAYKRGAQALFQSGGATSGLTLQRIINASPTIFALPKVVRPRVVTDEHGFEWRLNAGFIEWRGPNAFEWGDKLARGAFSLSITKHRAAIIADLLARPTEEVDDA